MMQNKANSILLNAAGTFFVWAAFGAACWYALNHFDPAASLADEELVDLSTNLRTLAATLAQIAATMAGFILAALALLLSLSERDLIKRMSVSGHLHVLILRMKMSLVFCLVLTVIGVALIVIPGLGVKHLYFAASTSASVALSILDVLRKLLMVFFFLSPLPQGEKKASRTLYEDTPPA
jgi:hypothetical protein